MSTPPYFPTPFQFDNIMSYLGMQIDGNGYLYTYTSVPTDAASYAANVTWLDTKTQPTWAYITTGAGWNTWNTYYQNGEPVFCGTGDTALAELTTNVLNAVPMQVQTNWTATSGLAQILNKPTLSTVATSGSYTDLSNQPSIPAVASISTGVSHSLNSAFQISLTRNCLALYSVSTTATISLTTGQTETVSLQVCPTSTGTFVAAGTVSNGNTGSLTVGLNLSQVIGQQVVGFVPAGYYAKIVSSGAGSASYVTGQEILM